MVLELLLDLVDAGAVLLDDLLEALVLHADHDVVEVAHDVLAQPRDLRRVAEQGAALGLDLFLDHGEQVHALLHESGKRGLLRVHLVEDAREVLEEGVDLGHVVLVPHLALLDLALVGLQVAHDAALEEVDAPQEVLQVELLGALGLGQVVLDVQGRVLDGLAEGAVDAEVGLRLALRRRPVLGLLSLAYLDLRVAFAEVRGLRQTARALSLHLQQRERGVELDDLHLPLPADNGRLFLLRRLLRDREFVVGGVHPRLLLGALRAEHLFFAGTAVGGKPVRFVRRLAHFYRDTSLRG